MRAVHNSDEVFTLPAVKKRECLQRAFKACGIKYEHSEKPVNLEDSNNLFNKSGLAASGVAFYDTENTPLDKLDELRSKFTVGQIIELATAAVVAGTMGCPDITSAQVYIRADGGLTVKSDAKHALADQERAEKATGYKYSKTGEKVIGADGQPEPATNTNTRELLGLALNMMTESERKQFVEETLPEIQQKCIRHTGDMLLATQNAEYIKKMCNSISVTRQQIDKSRGQGMVVGG